MVAAAKGSKPAKSFVAGGLAGVIKLCVVMPIDTVKVKLQLAKARKATVPVLFAAGARPAWAARGRRRQTRPP